MMSLGDLSLPARFPTAAVLLSLWEKPWSPTAKRFAAHRLAHLHRLGFDVLEITTKEER